MVGLLSAVRHQCKPAAVTTTAAAAAAAAAATTSENISDLSLHVVPTSLLLHCLLLLLLPAWDRLGRRSA